MGNKSKSTLALQELEANLLGLTYCILKGKSSQNQKISKEVENSLRIILCPLRRWKNSSELKKILECLELWTMKSSQIHSFDNFQENIEFILHLMVSGFEPKTCSSIIHKYSFDYSIDEISASMNVETMECLLKHAMMIKTAIADDHLDMSLICVEILVALLERHTHRIFNFLGKILIAYEIRFV